VKRTPVIDRVLRRCEETGDGCWRFLGALSEGYGKVGLGGKDDGLDYAHRITYRHFVGEIPDGLDLDHLCRNRSCYNPWHLDPVTRHVNTLRGARTGYRATHCKWGHALTDDNIRRAGSFRACRTCHRERERARSAAKRAAA
jgi:hypothetical protein